MKAPIIQSAEVEAYRVPTERPEADGTLEWDATTLLVAEVRAEGACGVGLGYADVSTARLARDRLAPLLQGRSAWEIEAAQREMQRSVRNLGRHGVAAMAIALLDIALWDLKSRLLGLPLVDLLGAARTRVRAYASGGFTSDEESELRRRARDWVSQGFEMGKMKLGARPERDLERVAAVREEVGPGFALFVDANGAYTPKQALTIAEPLARSGVCWFEEPVSSDDLEGLRLLRDRAPAPIEIAAGEYGYDLFHFRELLASGAVDVLQADATRCMGVSGFLRAGTLCEAHCRPLSAHTAPTLHAHLCCAVPAARHVECFFDHSRIESMLFEGALPAREGWLTPDRARPGLGLELRRERAEPLRVPLGAAA